MASYEFYIGIDPGVTTGVCVWNHHVQKIVTLYTMKIHQAFEFVHKFQRDHAQPGSFFLRVEDARKRHWFSNTGSEKWQGAGSIKRDCQIWEDFLHDQHIPFEMVAPRNNLTKLNHVAFGNITGHHEHLNQHQRDAAMIVFGI
jgi:hypothetical protein